MAYYHDSVLLRVNTITLFMCLYTLFPATARSQQATPPGWQDEVRSAAQAHDWTKGLEVVNHILASNPNDEYVRAWRARLLLWSGDIQGAAAQFLALTADSPSDPDLWQGLAGAYERESQWSQALGAIDHAEALDPGRADLHDERGRVLRSLNQKLPAREEFLQALAIDPGNAEAKAGLISLDPPATQELRVGTDDDLLNYTSAYQSEWIDLTSSWSEHWSTNIAGDFFQRPGAGAGKFVGSLTRKTKRLGAISAGGAIGHDNAIIPRSEAFMGVDRGWRTSENNTVRGIEATYDQHWYWYSTARVFTVSGGALVYLPRDWTWSISATGVRNSFPGLPASWQASGLSRADFPVCRWRVRSLSGNVFFAVGSEDFALVDQIGSFASQTYGGGFRFRLSANQDARGHASLERRTQGRTDITFGFSYGIRF